MSAPTVTVGGQPPRTSRPGITADTTAALADAAAANPGQWVRVEHIRTGIAATVKANLLDRFGDQVTVRYARCRAYDGQHRDLYVRLCCAATVQTTTPTEPLPFTLRRWFPRQVAA